MDFPQPGSKNIIRFHLEKKPETRIFIASLPSFQQQILEIILCIRLCSNNHNMITGIPGDDGHQQVL